MPRSVGPGEAARRLGISTRTVQRWLREGRLPAVKVGSRLKVDESALPAGRSGPQAQAATAPVPIRRLLVANRGELVVRIARTCRRLGINCLALVPDDQARAWWTSAADEIVPLAGGYLDIDAVLSAAIASGADAIHPGYGFLAENADFAEAVLRAGITWVGPPPAAMRALGDKASARRLALACGVPTLPGYDGDDQSDERLRGEANRLGFPLLIKPSAGGGGKGMHVVRDGKMLAETLARARREAGAAFGDERLILEKYLSRPRHVEVQLLCDGQGNAVHLGERDCSLQRRHQKVVEEAPAPGVGPGLRARLGGAALSLARSAGYEGAGTAEFLLAADGSFYFLELNARLQVEHPVTELVTGRDLVADQLAVAAGEPLTLRQDELELSGHAVEVRLYAEDPHAGFLPATGEIVGLEWPSTGGAGGLRIDAGVGVGDVVGTRYDPLLAKLICHAADRKEALNRLAEALRVTSVLGVTTNRGFLAWLLGLPEVQRGNSHTELIDERWRAVGDLPPEAARAAAAVLAAHRTGSRPESSIKPGFRLNSAPLLRLQIDGQPYRQAVPEHPPANVAWLPLDPDTVLFDFEGRSLRARLLSPPSVEAALRHAGHDTTGTQLLSAQMPGTVLDVRVGEGDDVEAGQPLLILEAMKMENAVSAPAPARVTRVLARVGQQVQRGDALIELA